MRGMYALQTDTKFDQYGHEENSIVIYYPFYGPFSDS